MSSEYLRTLFLPSASDPLIVGLCYLYIFYFGYQRFAARADRVVGYEGPASARSWTTFFRYHVAVFVYLALLGSLFRVVQEYPEIITAALNAINPNLLSENGPLGPLLGRSRVLLPISSVVLMYLLIVKVSRVEQLDRTVRVALQRAGAIPHRVNQLVRLMKHSDITLREDDDEALPGGLDQHAPNGVLYAADRSLPANYLRVRALTACISEWRHERGSAFHEFVLHNMDRYEALMRQSRALDAPVAQYVALSGLTLQPWADSDDRAPGDDEGSGAAPPMAMPEGLDRVVRKALADIQPQVRTHLENLYTFIGCGLLKTGRMERSRRANLRALGFNPPPLAAESTLNANDGALLGVAMMFAAPLVAVMAYFLLGWRNEGEPARILTIWTPMAISVALVSVYVPVWAKAMAARPDSDFWAALRSRGSRSWALYVVAALLAALLGIVVLVGIGMLDSASAPIGLTDRFRRVMPWSLVPFGLAAAIGFSLDNGPSTSRWAEGVIAGLVTAAFGGLAMFSRLEGWGGEALSNVGEVAKFVTPMSFLMGFASGIIVPSNYRSQSSSGLTLEKAPTDLNALVERAVAAFRTERVACGLAIRSETGGDPLCLLADANILSRALRGLLWNAALYTPRPGKIAVACKTRADGGVEIVVSDTGIGIAKQALEEVLNTPVAMDQLSDEANSDGVVGLMVIRGLIELHGGQLYMASRRNRGTVATIVFPATLRAAAAGVPPRPEPEALAPAASGPQAAGP